MKTQIGFKEALLLTDTHIQTSGSETLSLAELSGRVLAEDVVARVDSPSVNASLKDGFAVCSQDLRHAGENNGVSLTLVGSASAGVIPEARVSPGKAVRVTTGAPIPEGADAVVSEEFVTSAGEGIVCYNTAEPGRNILEQASDIRFGEAVAGKGEKITPAMIGLMATAGIEGARVFRQPVVGVIATGDEVLAPGLPLQPGKLYASNITAICAWLRQFNITSRVTFAKDRKQDTILAIERQLDGVDAFISSGGIWGSEKDLMLDVLETLKWQGVYHRVKMGPGKAVAFGILRGKPFFCLPGGPPSNEMAFLQIALPGILRMAGESFPPFPLLTARLSTTVTGEKDWTRFIKAEFKKEEGCFRVTPLKQKSRLQTMAVKNALVVIPEGCEQLNENDLVDIQVLDSRRLHEA